MVWCQQLTRFNIGSGNGLLPDGTKPLPEPMLTYHQWGSVAFTWEQFHGTGIMLNKSPRNWHIDAIFKCIFLNENVWITIEISLKFVPKDPINNIPALVQIMAWHQPAII